MINQTNNKKLLILPFLGMLAMAGAADCQFKPYSDPLCRVFNSQGACTECSFRSLWCPITKRCKQVSDQCKTWCEKTGACTSCYGGYVNVNGECVIATGIPVPPILPKPCEQKPEEKPHCQQCKLHGGDWDHKKCQHKDHNCKKCDGKDKNHKKCDGKGHEGKKCEHHNKKWQGKHRLHQKWDGIIGNLKKFKCNKDHKKGCDKKQCDKKFDKDNNLHRKQCQSKNGYHKKCQKQLQDHSHDIHDDQHQKCEDKKHQIKCQQMKKCDIIKHQDSKQCKKCEQKSSSDSSHDDLHKRCQKKRDEKCDFDHHQQIPKKDCEIKKCEKQNPKKCEQKESSSEQCKDKQKMFGRMGKKFFKKDFKKKLNEKIRFSINKNLLAHEHVRLGGKY